MSCSCDIPVLSGSCVPVSNFHLMKRVFIESNQYGEFRIIKKLFKQYEITSIEGKPDNSIEIHYSYGYSRFVWYLKPQ